MKKMFFAAFAALFIMTSCGGNALDKALSQCEEAIEQLENAKTADEADKAREAVSAAFDKMSGKETFDVYMSLSDSEKESFEKRAEALFLRAQKAAEKAIELK